MLLAFLHATRVVAQCKMPVAPGRGAAALEAPRPLAPMLSDPCRSTSPVRGYFNGDKQLPAQFI